MKVSAILEHIDLGTLALPEFQRGYVWNRGQVRDLINSMYHEHPVGSLLVWITDTEGAARRGKDPATGTGISGRVSLILDGQQRITTLYGLIRGKPPASSMANRKLSPSFTSM